MDSASFRAKNDEWRIKNGGVKYDVKNETATFIFGKTLPKGKGQLKLKFKGVLNDKMRGFYRSRY